MAKIRFRETQQYKNILVLKALVILTLVATFLGVFLLNTSESKYVEAFFFFAMAFCLSSFIWWLTKLKLIIAATKKNIKFKLFPLYHKKHVVAWKDIESCSIVKTSELSHCNGGHVTFLLELWFLISGKRCLVIKTKEGKYFFVGCRDTFNLQSILNKKVKSSLQT